MERRIVLLGKTGSGKSSTGNTILKGNYFKVKSSTMSVTKICQVKEVKNIKVIDTPGMFNTSLTPSELESQLDQCVTLSGPGPHVFLLVIRLGRFTEDENAVTWIQEIFGEHALRYTMVLFTHTDQLETMTLEECLAESPWMTRLLHECGNRYQAFNNRDPDPVQVNELMKKIDEMVLMNRGNYYTIKMYKQFQRNKTIETAATAASVATICVAAAALTALIVFHPN